MIEEKKTEQTKTIGSSKIGLLLELSGFVLTFGLTLIIPAVIFIYCGIGLDNYYQTTPLFAILGVLLSLVSIAYITYKEITHLLKKL